MNIILVHPKVRKNFWWHQLATSTDIERAIYIILSIAILFDIKIVIALDDCRWEQSRKKAKISKATPIAFAKLEERQRMVQYLYHNIE